MQVHSGSTEQQAADKAKVERQLAFMEEWKKQFDQLPEETQAVIFWNPVHLLPVHSMSTLLSLRRRFSAALEG